MRPHILDVDLDNLHLIPKECMTSVFWELDEADDLDPFFQKEEWFSSTLLEWGRCGKLMVEEETALAFAQYAPATLFPRLRHFRTGRVSPDAAYLSYCFVVEGRRGPLPGVRGGEPTGEPSREPSRESSREPNANARGRRVSTMEVEPGWLAPGQHRAAGKGPP